MFEIGLRPEPAESGFELALAMVQATGFPLRIHVERNRSRPVVKHSQTVGLSRHLIRFIPGRGVECSGNAREGRVLTPCRTA